MGDIKQQAEMRIIGALAIGEDVLTTLRECESLTPEMLGGLPASILAEYRRAGDRGIKIDTLALCEKLAGEAIAEDLTAYLKACIAELPFGEKNVAAWAGLVAEYWKREQIQGVSNYVGELKGREADTARGLLSSHIDSLWGEAKAGEAALIGDIAESLKKTRFVDRAQQSATGMERVDKMVTFDGGEMICLAARPAVGKSALALQIALHWAASGKRVGFFSLEMSSEQIGERAVAMYSGIHLERIKRGTNYLGNEEKDFAEAAEELKKLELYVYSGAWTATNAKRKARLMGLEMLVVDYIQLIKPETKRSQRYVEVGEISHDFKALAMELNIPVIILSQLNRASESRADKKPSMADLRESGDIEQDASVIMLLYQKDEGEKTKRVIDIVKNRQGICGTVSLTFDGKTMWFWENGEDVETKKKASGNPFVKDGR
jgi:replicative DNA helicase